MCGIFGFNWEDASLLKRGLQKIEHRGPDASGVFRDKNVSLAHARLSIVDLSPRGKQPMTNESKTIWITFNGEIYNHLEIRKTLKKKHAFVSESDTELLIHLYEEDGTEMLKKLQGMFSFCIYDSEKKILFMARDRLGIKPLYYYIDGKKCIFASEIKALLEEKKIIKKLNHEALSSFLTFRANTQEETFFKGIKKLMPGHFLLYDLKNFKSKIEKWWDVDFTPEYKTKKQYAEQILNLLDDAVHARLMSDVPYGAYLSGGVDSGAIVALMKKHSTQKVKTFSVGFKEEKNSELSEARFLSNWLGTDHHELTLTVDAVKALPDIVYQSDEPLADPTAIPIYFLSQYAKKYCTVILTGEGADELFAGYPQYKFMKLHASFFKNLSPTSKKIIKNLAKNAPAKMLNKGFKFASSLGERGKERFYNYLDAKTFEAQYLNQVAIFNEQEQEELLMKPIQLHKRYMGYFVEATRDNIVGKCELLELKEPMVEDLLMKIDKNAMAFAIEGRVPFLDYRLVELATKIPDKMKLRGLSHDKDILRFALRGILPAETLYRKKRHFFVPIDIWLEKYLDKIKKELLSEKYIKRQGLFNYKYIEKMNANFEKSKLFYSRQLWALITFQIWYAYYFENKKVTL